MIIDFPGAFPPAVSRALVDPAIASDLRDALRVLAAGKDEDRPDALDVIRDSVDGDEDGPRGLRLFPALVALSAIRESYERAALVGSAGSLELVRLAAGVDVPSDLEEEWEQSRRSGLQLLVPLLAEEVDEALLAPLLAAVAALHGAGELAGIIASADELLNSLGGEDGDEEAEDEEED